MHSIEGLPIAVLGLDQAQRIVEVDPKAPGLLGVEKSDLVGRAIDELFSPKDRKGSPSPNPLIPFANLRAPFAPSRLIPNSPTFPMALEVKIPPMGESISSGILAKWHVKDGDVVKKDQPLFELGTDKITSEGLAEAAGAITLKVKAGDEVKIGQVVASIDPAATGGAAAGGLWARRAARAAAPARGDERRQPAGSGSAAHRLAGHL